MTCESRPEDRALCAQRGSCQCERDVDKARARQAAAAARDRWRSRPHITDAGLIVGRTENPTCAVCGGTLAHGYTEPTHPGCTPEQETA